MKITLSCKEFLGVANIVAKSIQSKDVGEQTTSIKVANGKMILTHYSGTSLFKGTVNIVAVEGLEEGESKEWIVSGVQLKVILSVLQDSNDFVSFNIDSGDTQFTISSGTSNLKLPIIEALSRIPEEQIEALGEVSATVFLDTLQKLSKIASASPQTQGSSLSCVYIAGQEDELVLMGTDAVCLAEKKIVFDLVDNPFYTLIKSPQAVLLNSNTFSADDIVTLYQTPNMFGYIDRLGVLCLVSKTDETPLEYEPFKTIASSEQFVEVSSEQLKFAVDSVCKLSNDNSDIIIKLDNSKMTVENIKNDIIEVPNESVISDDRLLLNRHSTMLLTSLLSDKIRLCWNPNAERKIILIQLLNDKKEVDESSFIVITTNKERTE